MVLCGLADSSGSLPLEQGHAGWPHGRPIVPENYWLDEAAQRSAFACLLQAGALVVDSSAPGAGVRLAPPPPHPRPAAPDPA